jgi:hypothetical protein
MPYIIDRARQHVNSQGFIPATNIEAHVRRNQIWLADIGGQAAGYIFSSGGIRKPLVLRHNTVEEELWDRGLGTAFAAWLVDFAATATPFTEMYIRTRRDLVRQIAINAAVGGAVCSTLQHVGCRGHAVDVWRVPLWGGPVA